MTEPLCIFEPIESGIGRLLLNRPECCNALSVELLDALLTTIRQLEADPALTVVILRGAGRAFCAGLDLRQASSGNVDPRAMTAAVTRLLATVYDSRLVFIGAVHGAACGGGAGLTSVCDLSVATRDFRIGLPEVRRGLTPALLLPILKRKLRDSHLRELILPGEGVSAQRAYEIGLITRVVDDLDGLDDVALSLARSVVQGCPSAIASAKTMIADLWPRPLADELADSLELHMQSWQSESAAEGVRAFVEKRAPNW